VLDALGMAQAHFLGYSMGGRVGFDLGVHAPHRFLSLAIGGQTPFARDPKGVQAAAEQAALYRQEGIAGVIASAERATGELPPERRERLLAEDPEALAAVWEALAAVPSLEAEMPAFRLPTLVYCGEQDGGHAGAQRAAALMPEATFVSLPGLTHTEGWRRSDLVIPHLWVLHARVEATAVGGV
jgi:pimeloyl-ACP methyl ester carboxylesterase